MTIHPLAAAPNQSGADTSSTQASSLDNVDENQFLQLLVAQIKYQDPTNPTDSTTFVTQLAQFSSLEQLIAIRGELGTQTAAESPASVNSLKNTQGGS